MKISTDNRILAFIAGYTRQNGISPTDEHHVRLIMANGENKYLSFAMHEGAPVFSGPFCMNDIHEAGDVIACCAMTEEAYDSAIEKYLG